jgi:BASS family bile acid:Na+ symporter
MDAKQLVVTALQVSIIATVFGFGLKATTDDMLYLARRPGLLLRSLFAMLVLMPVMAILLVQAFEFPRVVEIALVALAISPVPPLLPNREGKAGGLASYGLGLMVTLGVLSIVVVPAAVALLSRIFDVPLGMAPSVIAGIMLKTLVGPLAVGLAVRALAPALAARIAGPVGVIALVLLALGSLVVLVSTLPALWGLVGDGTVIGLVIFVVLGLLMGHAFGGPDPEQASVLALSTACRHPILAMTIAATNFPEERFGAVIILYLLVNIVVSIPYIGWQTRHAAAASSTA